MTLSQLMPGFDLPAITAAILSARFPGVTSAGRLPCTDRVVRLVAGGFFEHSGLTTAIELIRLIRQKAAESNVVLTVVQIENSRATTDWSFEKGAPPPAPDHYLPELMSPLRAIAGTRQARADLARVAESTGLAADEVIRLHTGTEYTVYAIGFCPGFPYLGYLPEPLCGVPRLEAPRLRVEPGSVGLTGRQTGIYTEARPGGWNLIGRTPLQLVNVVDGYFPLRTGDRIRFERIGTAEFRRLQGQRL